MSAKTREDNRRRRGFERAGGLVQSQIRKAGETRGFAETRLLTDWAEIVGPDIAACARPVEVSYKRGGFGATLVLLTTGAHAPMLQAEIPKLKERVNACYGYSAVSHIRITQTAPTGFAEGRVEFKPARKAAPEPRQPDAATRASARGHAAGVKDSGLADALARLAENVLTTQNSKRGS